jgi:alpha-ketoglutarate-dependent dioxygenase FTO
MAKKRKKGQKKRRKKGAAAAAAWPLEGGGSPSAPGLVPGAPTACYVAPPELAKVPAGYLLEPGEPHYDACVRQCYRGFVHQPAGVPAPMEQRLLGALESLKANGYFHCDVVQGMGSWMRTFVRRILVGAPGMTYSYLGLRIFAHPWERKAGATPEMEVIARTNDAVTVATQRLLDEGKGVGKGGRCDYNVTLINLMEDQDHRGGALRNKSGNNLGGGQVAVSWHADSSLENFSSIAVLNLHIPAAAAAEARPSTPKSSARAGGGSWNNATVAATTGSSSSSGDEGEVEKARPFRIALRCVGDGHDKKRGGGTRGTPAVAVPLASGDAYYFLNDFNHHHHHAVLAGSGCGRYSSTHRVAVTERDTFHSIEHRASVALERVAPTLSCIAAGADGAEAVVEAIRESEEVHSELEFEWLRQWGVQGQAHAETHGAYWAPRMAQLRDLWRRLEERTADHCRFIAAAASAARVDEAALRRCCEVLQKALLLRRGDGTTPGPQARWGGGRCGWAARVQNSAYTEVAARYRPFNFIPAPSRGHLDEMIASQLDALGKLMARRGWVEVTPVVAVGGGGGQGKRRRTAATTGEATGIR